MSAATQISVPSRVAVRWYQIAVLILGLALAAVTALAVYLAVDDSTATARPAGTPATVDTGTADDHPCYKPRVAC